MNTFGRPLSRKSFASLGAMALFAATAAAAPVPSSDFPEGAPLDASGNYQSEVQACKTGKTAEDQATCLREARNAHADIKRGLINDSGVNFEANARARCDALQGQDKGACEARMMGFGSVSGSVASGGLLREVETVVMPPGQQSITINAQTPNPVVLVPQGSSGNTQLMPVQP